MAHIMRHANDRPPNFRDPDGSLYLVRCFVCGGEHGTENWAPAVATGACSFCGWSEDELSGAKKRTDKNLRRVFGG